MASMSTNWRAGQGRQDDGSGSRFETDNRQQDKLQQDSQTLGLGQSDAAEMIAGRSRIYLGSLLYDVKPDEIDNMLAANGFREDVESVHISMDAISGRNPGYCFINFKNSDSAQSALDNLAGHTIRGRPVKVGPCKQKGAERAWKDPNYTPTFQRWGDWKGRWTRNGGGRSSESQKPRQGPYMALQHFQDVKKTGAKARVCFGGLGKMINQGEHDKEVRGYLNGFDIVAISKRSYPPPSARKRPGNHHYCFVDFENLDDAKAAVRTLDGKSVPGGRLRVSLACGPTSSARGYIAVPHTYERTTA